MTGPTWGDRTGRVSAMRSAVAFVQSRPVDVVRQRVFQAAMLSTLAAVFALSGVARAQMTVLENFESYADDNALRAAWVPQAPLPPGNVTLVNAGIDGKSMSITYNLAGGTNTVEFTFPADQNFTLRTTVRILYHVVSGSADEDINFQFLDSADNVLISS